MFVMLEWCMILSPSVTVSFLNIVKERGVEILGSGGGYRVSIRLSEGEDTVCRCE